MSETVQDIQLERQGIPAFDKYSEDEQTYLVKLRKRLGKANDQRSASYTELDDMDYITYYDRNFKTDLAYIRRRKNPEERLVVTGTVRQKDKSILAALLNYNLEPNIIAFDKNDMMLYGIGNTIGDLVKKSREIENYDQKRPMIYREGIVQGNAYVEELWYEEYQKQKTISKDWDTGKVNAIKWEEELVKVASRCEARLIPGKRVFLGNIFELYIQNQPFIFTIDMLSYEEAKSVYGEWDRFEYVPKKVTKLYDYANLDIRTQVDGVERIHYYDKFNNEFNIILNGVMMLKVGFPLSVISPSGKYPIAQLPVDPLRVDFAYCRSIPAETKFDQEVLDDFIRTFIVKAQQSMFPPMANNTGRAISRNIFLPGTFTDDINPDRLKAFGVEFKGVQPAEAQVFQMIKQIVDEKALTPQLGQMPKGKINAQQQMEVKRQEMMRLGLLMWGIISFEKDLCELRIHNILDHWTQAIDKQVDPTKKKLKDIYQQFSIDSTDELGRPIRKVVEFNPEATQSKTPEMIDAENNILSRPGEPPVKKVYLNGEELRKFPINWYISITPTEKETTELQKTMWTQRIAEGYQLFGKERFQQDYVENRWAVQSKEDPDKLFVKTPPQQPGMPPQGQQPPQQGQQPGGEGQQMAKQMGQSMTNAVNKPNRPTLNTMTGAQ